jgi:glycine hydroxymethyltransferase
MITSGLRLGTAALTTRGMNTDDMKLIASMIDRVLASSGDSQITASVREEVRSMCDQHPLYGH